MSSNDEFHADDAPTGEVNMDTRQAIEAFLARGPYAVVGASTNRDKYGNKVLRCYLQHELEVYPVNPNREQVEQLTCYPGLSQIPAQVRCASVITPPQTTLSIIEDAATAGIRFVWMQPGAESAAAIDRAQQLGITVIAGGPCILVALGFRDV